MVVSVSDGESAISEMAIVDTFTKLIFGESADYSEPELRIIQSMRSTDASIALDDYEELGVYLRGLGVQEMIGLVSRVSHTLANDHLTTAVPITGGGVTPTPDTLNRLS